MRNRIEELDDLIRELGKKIIELENKLADAEKINDYDDHALMPIGDNSIYVISSTKSKFNNPDYGFH
ncbi:MAG TPA: hypothetical protein VJH65_03415 [Candidatus Nanoarchaeia archaeon]|nr:hypothetical protein [Candidatus Nanoarchaeia archaeon]